MSGPAQPLVTVVVPTFNRPDLLPHALESIAAQTWRNLQVIVVNDAGASAAEAVAPFRGRLDLLHLEHGTNRGLAATRNTALRAARGDWIAYLDDDDRFLPRHVETMVNALTAAGAVIGYADSTRVEVEPDGAGGFRELRRVPVRIPYDRARVILKSYIPVQSVVHARACLDRTGPFDEALRHREDWDLWIRMCRHWDFLHVPEVTTEYHWKVSGPSLSNETAARFNEARAHILGKNPDLFGPCLDVWEARLDEQARVIRALEAELARLRGNPLVRAGRALRRILRGGG